jgi:hypothetical protein
VPATGQPDFATITISHTRQEILIQMLKPTVAVPQRGVFRARINTICDDLRSANALIEVTAAQGAGSASRWWRRTKERTRDNMRAYRYFARHGGFRHPPDRSNIMLSNLGYQLWFFRGRHHFPISYFRRR